MNVLQKRLVQRVTSVTGCDPLERTRRREVVEARAMLMMLLRDVCYMNSSEIARFLTKSGKPTHHATVLHAFKNVEVYMQFSYKFRMCYEDLLAEGSWGTMPAKKAFIKNKLDWIPEEAIDEVYSIVSAEYRV